MRRAITLLEVLISMFILTVGILGVMSLIPLGHSEVSKAVATERAANCAAAALNEIHIRGFIKAPTFGTLPTDPPMTPAHWISPFLRADGTDELPAAVMDTNAAGQQVQVGEYWAPFVIDPVVIADNAQQTNKAPTLPLWPQANTPYLNRCTLRTLTEYFDNSTNPPTSYAGPLAREWFAGHDELSFTLPKKEADPATQVFSQVKSGTATTNIKRQSEDRFTWVMYVEPQLNMIPKIQTPTEYLAVINGLYNVSVVVFQQRGLFVTRQQADPPLTTDEQLLPCDAAQMSQGGGFVKVTYVPMDLKAGQWTLLAVKRQNVYRYFWYRIAQSVKQTTQAEMITLAGQDFSQAVPPVPNEPAWLLLIPGIVEVRTQTHKLAIGGSPFSSN